MHLVVPTVPHSGTLFVTHLLIDSGYDHRSLQDSRKDWDTKAVFTGHLVKQGRVDDAVDALRKYPGIVPLRHPYLTAESWIRRGKSLEGLIDAWLNLVEFIEPLNPFYLPMDVPSRQRYLDQISQSLNLDIKTKWPVINSKHNTSGLTYKDVHPPNEIRALAKELDPFLRRFYL